MYDNEIESRLKPIFNLSFHKELILAFLAGFSYAPRFHRGRRTGFVLPVFLIRTRPAELA